MDNERVSRRRLLAATGAALVAGCAEAPAASETGSPGGQSPGVGSQSGSDQSQSAANNPYTEVYRETIGSVVSIRTFDGGGQRSQGSGWVFDDGHVVTNQHVVDGATDFELRFSQGDWRTADIAGADVYSDLAALSVDDVPDYGESLALVEADPPVGTEVVALGNPFGFRESVSAGIVSGVDRSLPGANNFSIPDAIQTDAAVNPGNSGGPLVNLAGDVVGVISSAGGENLGFAISAGLAGRVVPALVSDGQYDHAYMGVSLLPVTPTVAEANDLDRARGVLVVEVVDGEPSDGVLQGSEDEFVDGQQIPTGGDVVVALDGTEVVTLADLSTYLALNTSPGDDMQTTVIRDGEETTVTLTLGERPPPSSSPSFVDASNNVER